MILISFSFLHAACCGVSISYVDYQLQDLVEWYFSQRFIPLVCWSVQKLHFVLGRNVKENGFISTYLSTCMQECY